jgi:hypothetical protein
MIVVEREEIELDYCTNCSGVWFDSGELELLLQCIGLEDSNLRLTSTLALPEVKTVEKKRKCPICRRKMKKTTAGKEQPVLIDVCPQGEGLWFDGGELTRLITQYAGKQIARPDSHGHILSFVGETLRAEKDQAQK